MILNPHLISVAKQILTENRCRAWMYKSICRNLQILETSTQKSTVFDFNDPDAFLQTQLYKELCQMGEDLMITLGDLKGLAKDFPDELIAPEKRHPYDLWELRIAWKDRIEENVESDLYNLLMVYDNLMDIDFVNVPQEKQKPLKSFFAGLKRSATKAQSRYDKAVNTFTTAEEWSNHFKVIVDNTDKALTFLTNFFTVIGMQDAWLYAWPKWRLRQAPNKSVQQTLAEVPSARLRPGSFSNKDLHESLSFEHAKALLESLKLKGASKGLINKVRCSFSKEIRLLLRRI